MLAEHENDLREAASHSYLLTIYEVDEVMLDYSMFLNVDSLPSSAFQVQIGTLFRVLNLFVSFVLVIVGLILLIDIGMNIALCKRGLFLKHFLFKKKFQLRQYLVTFFFFC